MTETSERKPYLHVGAAAAALFVALLLLGVARSEGRVDGTGVPALATPSPGAGAPSDSEDGGYESAPRERRSAPDGFGGPRRGGGLGGGGGGRGVPPGGGGGWPGGSGGGGDTPAPSAGGGTVT